MSQVYDSGISDVYEHSVMMALANHCDDQGVCFPSIKRIAKMARVSERGCQKLVKRLEERGYITIKANAGPRGTNLYVLDLNPRTEFTPEPRSPRTGVQGGVNGSAKTPEPRSPETSINIKETSEEEKGKKEADLFGANGEPLEDQPKPDPIEEGFEAFWTSWPSHNRKFGKADCRKVYRSACEGKHPKFDDKLTPDQLNEAAKRYLKTVSGPQFLKGILSWLRQAGFEPFIFAAASAFRPFEDLNPSARSALENGRVPPSMTTPDGLPTAEAAHHLRRFGYEVPA